MKVVQRIKIAQEVTQDELSNIDLGEFEKDLLDYVRSEANEDAIVSVSVTIED